MVLSRGGMHGFIRGACVVLFGGVHGFIWGGMHGFIWGVCGFIRGGMHGFIRGGVHGFSSFFGYNEIRSMSGRYASYWNAFLLALLAFLMFLDLYTSRMSLNDHKETNRFKTLKNRKTLMPSLEIKYLYRLLT